MKVNLSQPRSGGVVADQDDAGGEMFLQVSCGTQTSRRVRLLLQENQAWAVRMASVALSSFLRGPQHLTLLCIFTYQ